MLINIILFQKVQIVLYLKPKTGYFPTEALKNQNCALHRGAFCQFQGYLLQYGNRNWQNAPLCTVVQEQLLAFHNDYF